MSGETETSSLKIDIDTTEAVQSVDQLKVAMAEAKYGAESWQAGVARQTMSMNTLAASMPPATAGVTVMSKEYQKLDSDVTKFISSQDKTAKALAELTKTEGMLTAARNAGVISQGQMNAMMTTAQGAYSAAGVAGAAHAGIMTTLGLNTQRSTQHLAMMGREVATGEFSRIPRSFAGLLLHSHLLAAALSPLGLLVIGIAAAFGMWVYSLVTAEKLNRAISEMQAQLAGVGKVGVFSSQQLFVMVQTMERLHGVSRDTAEKIVGEFTKGGGIGYRMVQPLLALVPAFAAAVGEDMPSAAKRLAKAFDDPISGVLSLDKEMNLLTLSQLKQIESMKQHGDSAGAAELGFKVLQERLKGIHEIAVTPLEKATNELSVAWKGAMTEMSNSSTLASVVSWFANLVESTRKVGDNILYTAMVLRQQRTGQTPEQQAAAGSHMPEGYGTKKYTTEEEEGSRQMEETDRLIAKRKADRMEQQAHDKERWLAEGLAAEKKYAQEMAAIVMAANDNSQRYNADFIKGVALRNAALKSGVIDQNAYNESIKRLVATTQIGKDADHAAAEAKKIIIELAKEHTKEVDKEIEAEEHHRMAIESAITKVREHTELLDAEVATMKLGSKEKYIQIELMRLKHLGFDTENKDLQELIRRQREDLDILKEYAATEKMWDSMGDKFSQFIVSFKDGWRGGMDYAKNELKQLAQQLLAFFAKKWFLQVVAGGTFGSTAAGAAGSALNSMGTSAIGSALGGGGSVLGSAGNMIGGAFGAGGIYGTAGAYGAALGTTSIGAGSQAALLAAQTAEFGAEGLALTGSAAGGVAGGITSALAAIPVWGWIAIAALAAYAYFGGKGGGPKSGGSASFDVNPDGSVTQGQMTERQRFYSAGGNVLDSVIAPITQATAKSYADLSKLFGGKGQATFTQSMDTDPQGKADNRVATQAFMNGVKIFEQKNESLGRDDKAIGPELQLQAGRALLAALQQSQLPNDIAQIIDSVAASTATQEQITDVLSRAKMMQDYFGSLDVALLTTIAPLKTSVQLIAEQGKALADFAKASDRSAQSLATLTTGTAQFRAAVTMLIQQLQDAKTGISASTDTAVRNMIFGTLDKAGQYGMLQSEAQGLKDSLGGLNDPAMISSTVAQIIALSGQAFGMLTPEQQKNQLNDFVTGLRETQKVANDHLSALQKEAAAEANRQLAAIKANIDRETQAANTNLAASNNNLAASNTNAATANRGVNITINGQPVSQVGS